MKSKRFWLSLIVFFTLIGVTVHAINKGTDLLSLSAAFVAIVAQVWTYMDAETKRPSVSKQKENES